MNKKEFEEQEKGSIKDGLRHLNEALSYFENMETLKLTNLAGLTYIAIYYCENILKDE